MPSSRFLNKRVVHRQAIGAILLTILLSLLIEEDVVLAKKQE